MSQSVGTPGGSALGLPFNPDDEGSDQDLSTMLGDEAPGDVTEDAPPRVDDPSSGVFGDHDDEEEAEPEAPTAEAAETETEEEGEAPPDPGQQTVTFMGREQTLAQAEAQFKEIQRGFTELAQGRQQSDAEVAQLRTEQAQVREYLLRQAAEQDPEVAERIRREQETSRLVDERVQQQIGPIQEQQQRQQAVQAVVAEAQEAVQGFYQRNGITQGDERDNATLSVFQQIAAAGYDVDLTNAQHLDYALAVADGRQAPPVGVIMPGPAAGPAPIQGATLAPASAAPSNGAPAQPKAPVRRRVEAHVETGGSGAPASSAPQPTDEFEEAWAWHQGRKAQGPLFGSART